MSHGRKTRGYCFTVNNYSPEDIDLLNHIDCQYLCYGKEEAPSTHTPHLQGYVYWAQPKEFADVLSRLPKGCHLEAARGSGVENRDYCKKDGRFTERGTCPKDKALNLLSRSDYAAAISSARLDRLDDIDPVLFTRYWRFYEYIKAQSRLNQPAPPALEDLPGRWYYGPAGSGKSVTARQEFPAAYPKLCNKWWDGYQHQDAVIMDDLDPDMAKCLSHHLKIWGDRYWFLGEIKNGTVFIRPNVFIVTTQYSIEECFADEETRDAIRRRFAVTHFRLPFVYKK